MKIQRIPQPKLDALLLNQRRKQQKRDKNKRQKSQQTIMRRKMELARKKSERQTKDGTYKYTYQSPLGKTVVHFQVFNGIIQKSNQFKGPVELYVNQHITRFENARLHIGWKWQFDSLEKKDETCPVEDVQDESNPTNELPTPSE